ncbi:MAG: hypothetical protein PSV35_00020 [bacterium]|nr:hypothetical protein [bacterium]
MSPFIGALLNAVVLIKLGPTPKLILIADELFAIGMIAFAAA